MYGNKKADNDEMYLAQNIIGLGKFRKPRKGLINLNSLDDLSKM